MNMISGQDLWAINIGHDRYIPRYHWSLSTAVQYGKPSQLTFMQQFF
jgi:hypothetical protein